jgi:hypothetical protein
MNKILSIVCIFSIIGLIMGNGNLYKGGKKIKEVKKTFAF